MFMKLPFKLGDYEPACYEKEFIIWVLGGLIHKPELRKFSSNIQKAWRKLVSLNKSRLKTMIDITVQEDLIYPKSGVLLDFIRIVLLKADCSLDILEQKRLKQERNVLDSYTPRREIFNKTKKDLILIKDQTNDGLNDHVIDLVLALWIFKQKKGKKIFDTLWEFSEYWSVLKEECPELFYEPRKTKEKIVKMKKQEVIKKEKVAI